MSNSQMNKAPKRPTVYSVMLTQMIAVLGFVVVPSLVTFIAPVTTVRMYKTADGVSADVTKYVLLFLPLFHTTVERVEDVESHVTTADWNVSKEERRRGRTGVLVADGSVLIVGANLVYQVQSTPKDCMVEAKNLRQFLETTEAESYSVTITAGWLFSYLLGGVMTGLAILYCLGATLAILRWILVSLFSRTNDIVVNE